MSKRFLFIALHIICVRIRPDAPTIPPIATRRTSPIARPAIDPATPENELSREMVIGISAPPTLIEKRRPKANERTKAAIMSGRRAGMKIERTQSTREATREMIVRGLCPGITTGFPFITP